PAGGLGGLAVYNRDTQFSPEGGGRVHMSSHFELHVTSGAPAGAVVAARMSLRIRRGDFNASTCARNPPIDQPRMSADSTPSVRMTAPAKSAIVSTLAGTSPPDSPTPTLSNTIRRCRRANDVTRTGSQLSIVPRNRLSISSGRPAPYSRVATLTP